MAASSAFLAASSAALTAASPAGAAEAAVTGKPRVGEPAPDFTLKGLGRPPAAATSLKGLEGRVVLLDFWASWCAPCQRTLPELARMGSRHPGLKVLAVSLDEDRSKAQAFLRGRGGPDTSLAVLHDAKREVAARYDLAGMPAAVLIDRKGVLRARFDGYTERDLGKMETEARKLLEERP